MNWQMLDLGQNLMNSLCDPEQHHGQLSPLMFHHHQSELLWQGCRGLLWSHLRSRMHTLGQFRWSHHRRCSCRGQGPYISRLGEPKPNSKGWGVCGLYTSMYNYVLHCKSETTVQGTPSTTIYCANTDLLPAHASTLYILATPLSLFMLRHPLALYACTTLREPVDKASPPASNVS
jgi:hypothetical protein